MICPGSRPFADRSVRATRFDKFPKHGPPRFQRMLQPQHRLRNSPRRRPCQPHHANPSASRRSRNRDNRVIKIHICAETSVHNKQPRRHPRRRPVSRRSIPRLVALPRLQSEAPTIGQLRLQFAIKTKNDMPLLAPMIRQIPSRIFHHPHPNLAKVPSPPSRRPRLPGMLGSGNLCPICSGKREAAHLHEWSIARTNSPMSVAGLESAAGQTSNAPGRNAE